MKLKNREVYNAVNALNSFGNEKLPAKLAWRINTARTSLQPFFDRLQESLDETRLKHALTDKKGNAIPGKDENGKPVENTIQIDPKKIEDFNKEISDLLDEVVEVNNVEISISSFPDSLELTPNTMAGLQPLISDFYN